MSHRRTLPFLGRDEPLDPDGVRIENRSDRVWVYGFVRMIPVVMFFGTIAVFVAVMMTGNRLSREITFFSTAVVLILAVVLDRSALIDPVNYVLLGQRGIFVQRLAGRRSFWMREIGGVEFRQPSGEDYDEKQKARRFAEVTIRVSRWRFPARLLVSEREAGLVQEWAEKHGLSVHQSRTSPD